MIPVLICWLLVQLAPKKQALLFCLTIFHQHSTSYKLEINIVEMETAKVGFKVSECNELQAQLVSIL